MICGNCKAPLPEGTVFCPNCGNPVDSKAAVRHDVQDNGASSVVTVDDGTAAAPVENIDQSNNKLGLTGKQKGLAVGGIILALLLFIGAAFLFFGTAPTKAAVVEDGSTAKKHFIETTNSIGGLDTETGTKIPLQVVGQDANGMDYDYRYFVDNNGMMLPEGTYTISVAASPIAQDGTMYDIAGAKIESRVDAAGLDGQGGLDISLDACSPSGVTDEQLDEAYRAALEGGAKDAETADVLKNAATKKRDEAVAAEEKAKKEAEEKAAAEAAAKKQEAIDSAKERGLDVYEGTVRVFNSSEAMANFQGKANPDPGSTGSYTVLVFSSSKNVTATSGDGMGMRTSSATMISVGSDFSKYSGQTIAIGIDPSKTWWPSDVRLPLGQPYTKSAQLISAS